MRLSLNFVRMPFSSPHREEGDREAVEGYDICSEQIAYPSALAGKHADFAAPPPHDVGRRV